MNQPFFVLGILYWVFTANCSEYARVDCSSPAPYQGPALHEPIPDTLFAIAGDLQNSLDSATADNLEKAFHEAVAKTGAPSMSVAVGVPGRGIWSAEVSTATPARPLHFWASVGKSLTAMTVLRIEEQGRLALSDTLDLYVEGVPNGHVITLEHLLSHTSGLPSANEDPMLRARKRRIVWEEELGFLKRQGAMFCPGQYWRYSNSGYIQLGKVIEKVTGKPFHEAVREEVVQPLGLEHLRMLSAEDPCEDVAPLAPADPESYRIEPTWPGPAGSMVASAEDMVRLWCAFLRGEVVRSANMRRMFEKLYPMFDQPQYYGLGVMVYEVPQPDGSTQTWLGHSGGTSGAKAVVAYVPEHRAFVAVALTGDAPAEAVAFHLLGSRGKPPE